MTELRIIPARESDLDRYIDHLEEIADWLEARRVRQWPRGSFRGSRDYYAESIRRHEVLLAFLGDEFVGSFRLLLREPIVWPDVAADDAVYVFNLAVKRSRAGHDLGGQMLAWAADRARSLRKAYVRLDCMADNPYMAGYYARAGFEERGDVDAPYSPPVGVLRLKRFEKRLV
jgi:ribosomal protein S18 acetylase RimI-like enzyme